jgi:hypothetical protein
MQCGFTRWKRGQGRRKFGGLEELNRRPHVVVETSCRGIGIGNVKSSLKLRDLRNSPDFVLMLGIATSISLDWRARSLH